MRVSRTYALGLLFFLLSWLSADHYRPWASFHSEVLAFLGIFGLLVSVLIHQSGGVVVPRGMGWIAVATLLPWLQYVAGIGYFAGDALLSSLYLCGLSGAIMVGFAFSRAKEGDLAYGLTGVMHSLWIAAMVSAAIAWIQWLNLQLPIGMFVVQTEFGDPAKGNLGQPNQLGTLLLMGMIAYSYIYERRIIGAFGFTLGIFFMTSALVMTHSRAAMLGVLAIGCIFVVKRSRMKSLLSTQHVLGWVLLFGLANGVSPYIDEALMLSSDREPLFANNGRVLIWLQMLAGISKSPWVGYGLNQTATAHIAGTLDYPGSMTVTYAHNILLDIIAWNGIPLGVVMIGAGGYWFCTRIYRVSDLKAVYAMACLLPFTIHSLVEYPFAYAYFLIAAGLMVGVVEACVEPIKGWQIKRLWVGSALSVWVIVGGYIVHEYILIEEDFRIVRFENQRLGKTEATYQVPKLWMLSHMATMLKVARQPAVPNMTEQQLNDLRRVSFRFLYGAINLRYAIALGLNGDPDGARHMMAVVRATYGPVYYGEAKVGWQESTEKYPSLNAITLP
jgi:hypothetical protein